VSLGIVVKGPSGLVLAADSRVTLTAQPLGGASFPVHFDNASKLLRFGDPHMFVAAVTYGQALIPGKQRTAESFLPELQSVLPTTRLSVLDFAQRLSDFYVAEWGAAAQGYAGEPMWFLVGGFDMGEPYGSFVQFAVPSAPNPVAIYAGNNFGAYWGGQSEIVWRIWKGYQFGLPQRLQNALGLSDAQRGQIETALNAEELPIPVNVMALQDCVNLARTLIRTTIAMQQLSVVVRAVGGPIDIVTITRTDGVKPVRLKEISVDE
jgi:hypothetical protein